MAKMDTKEGVISNLDTALHFTLSTNITLTRHELATIMEALGILKEEYKKQGLTSLVNDCRTVTRKMLDAYQNLEDDANTIKTKMVSYYD